MDVKGFLIDDEFERYGIIDATLLFSKILKDRERKLKCVPLCIVGHLLIESSGLDERPQMIETRKEIRLLHH